MRKIMMMLLVLAMTVCGAVGIAACGKDPEPEQNQGQVEQNKDKDKEEVKPGQNEGENDKEEGKEDGKGDTGSENPTKPGENDPPVTPEPQKPNPETPPQDEEQKEEDKKEEDKKEEDKDEGKEEEPPQGDEPGTEPDEGKTDPEPDTPTKPDDKEPEGKDPEEEKKPETKPDQSTCDHTWEITQAVGTDPNNTQHVSKCSKCGKTKTDKCTWGKNDPVIHEPTCTEDGYKAYTCTVCHNMLKAPIFEGGIQVKLATGHKFEGKYTHVANSNPSTHEIKCVNAGCTATKTERCQFDSEIKEPTCTEDGSNGHRCKTCDFYESLFSGSTNSLGHNWEYKSTGTNQHTKRCTRPGCPQNTLVTETCSLEETETPASCTEAGHKTIICKLCNRNEVTKTSDPTGHKLKTEGNTSGNDYKGHWGECTVCGKSIGSKEKPEAHHFGKNNLCLTCQFDGILANGGYKFIPGSNQLGGVTNVKYNFMGNYSEIVLSEYPFGEQNGELTSLKKDAFQYCGNLVTLYIPDSVTSIDKDTFKNCMKLATIYFGGSQDDWDKLKENLGLPESVDVQCNKKYEETKTNTVSTAQEVALPAEDNKRLYA